MATARQKLNALNSFRGDISKGKARAEQAKTAPQSVASDTQRKKRRVSTKALTRTTLSAAYAEQREGRNNKTTREKKARRFSRYTAEDGEEFFVPEDEDGGDSVWELPEGAVLINM